MFKRVLIAAAVAAAVSAPAFADVSINGSAEMDLFLRTNATKDADTRFDQEVAIVINFNGSDKLDNGDTLKWKLAQKVATDYRYDKFGEREAWVGYAGGWGELRFGRQFTNTYLQLDWPYGTKGAGNLWADWGAKQDTWGDAISYFSPSFGGFTFAAQYKHGGQAEGAFSGTDAYDLTAALSVAGVNVDAGWQRHNDALVGTTSIGGAGSVGAVADLKGATTDLFHVGARASFGDVGVKAAYKRNDWSANGLEITQDQYLVAGSYSMGKHGFTLTYQNFGKAEINGQDFDTGINQVAFGWDYQLGKNTWGGLQLRHHMISDPATLSKVFSNPWELDAWGANGKKDNATRALVYTWTAF